MNKKQLSKLRRLPATNSMVALAKMPGRKERRYTCGLNKYRYRYMARCQYLNGILKLSICKTKEIRKGETEPKWDVYLSPRDKTCDLWTYGPGNLSNYFMQRVIQLCYKGEM